MYLLYAYKAPSLIIVLIIACLAVRRQVGSLGHLIHVSGVDRGMPNYSAAISHMRLTSQAVTLAS
jgi:hypothetical protein